MKEPAYTSGTNEHGTPIETVTVFNEDGTVYLSIDQEKVPTYTRQEYAEMVKTLNAGIEA